MYGRSINPHMRHEKHWTDFLPAVCVITLIVSVIGLVVAFAPAPDTTPTNIGTVVAKEYLAATSETTWTPSAGFRSVPIGERWALTIEYKPQKTNRVFVDSKTFHAAKAGMHFNGSDVEEAK